MVPPYDPAQERAKLTANSLANFQWIPLPEKVNLLVNVFTYDCRMGADIFTYCCQLHNQLRDHPRIENAMVSYTHGYPTTRIRNFAAQKGKTDGFHFLLMLDDDMKPDVNLGTEPGALPFLPTALDFALEHDRVKKKPCIVGAPYCGAPPEQRVMVMKNMAYAPDMPDGLGVKLGSFTRDEAAVAKGIQQVSALPTGCLLVDLRVLDVLPPPWFDYEYGDPPFNTALASTEDIVFTRNLDWLQVPQYCNWDSWAGHMKRFMTGKPRLAPIESIPESIRKAIFERGWRPQCTFDGVPVGSNGELKHEQPKVVAGAHN